MENNNIPNRDKMLEDILNDFNGTKRTSSVQNSRYASRNTGSNRVSRGTVNSYANRSFNNTTGFAVSKFSDDTADNKPLTNAATTKIDMSEKKSEYHNNSFTMHDRQFNTENKQDVYNKPVHNESQQYQRPRKPVKKKRKKRSARLPIVLMVTTLIVTVSICLSVAIIAIGRDMLAIGKDDSSKMVTIPENVNVQQVAEILEAEGIIDIPKAFVFFSGMSETDTLFIPGQYELSPSDAYEKIITKLTTEESELNINKETVQITFVEGISIYDAAQLLEENGVCEAERFIYYFNAGGLGFDFEEKLPKSSLNKFYKMEGYLFPDTYKFYVDSEPESVCMKIYQNFENKISEEHYKKMNEIGLTLDETITLASIVQAEAPTYDSMKKVASVLLNRLNNSDEFPKLQSDPTSYYVRDIIEPNIQISSTAILEAYDTYKGYGLPPGAIGNPGLDAIEAVLYAPKTEYYYFCADIDTKEIFYSETLDEHEEYLAMINGESSGEDNE